VIPNHILSHCPQTPYFKNEYYVHGGYKTVNDNVGDLIDFYMLQCYNQVDSKYDSYNELFIHATGADFNGTAIKEVNARGIPYNKLVVAKPILTTDATNTGWVAQTALGNWAVQAYDELGWYAGVAHWQYPSDTTGTAISQATQGLKDRCSLNKNCL
jgi:hypothetical protein